MKRIAFAFAASGAAALATLAGVPAHAATTIQVGASGKTFASDAVQCAVDPATNASAPMVQAGLFNPRKSTSAQVSLNGTAVATVTTADPVTDVWLETGPNAVVVRLSRKLADRYDFDVAPDKCTLPDTSGNTFNADGTLEYGANGYAYATVTPGCALNSTTGQAQPYVNLFDNGNYLINVSVNGIALTQLSPLRPHTPVFLAAGNNVISATAGSLGTDYFVRDGGDGRCTLP